jgi:hypothetical protein
MISKIIQPTGLPVGFFCGVEKNLCHAGSGRPAPGPEETAPMSELLFHRKPKHLPDNYPWE